MNLSCGNAFASSRNISGRFIDRKFATQRISSFLVSVSTEGSAAVYDPETGIVSIRETVAVSEVSSDGAAGGRLQKGDIVLSVTLGGRTYEITRGYMLIDAMLTARPGDAAVFRILRDGAEQTVTVQITDASLTDY